jgi:glycine dehydrogenase subunit 2
MTVIFDKSVKGRRGIILPRSDVPCKATLPDSMKRQSELKFCELAEIDVVRHFTQLSRKAFGVDTNFYPLGSCTMKYNPKICEKVAALPDFTQIHPLMPQLRRSGMLTQGCLGVIYELEKLLCEITGMDAFTLQPAAGAHGELTGIMLIAAYHKDKGNTHKTEVLIPDEAHGTNPASAGLAGYSIKSVATSPDGMIDIEAIRAAIGPQTAAIMLTNPNTLGIFNTHIKELADLAHRYDIQLYYDGANFNATLGKFRPGDGFFDVMHLNLHKTFATPHGGGGPGAGPVGVKAHLAPYLPISRVIKRSDNTYRLDYNYPKSIGYIAPFYGNFLICLRAYAYILQLGRPGIIKVSEQAVLNANYVMHKLKDVYEIPYLRTCMHEFVISMAPQAKKGVRSLDIAKALIDAGYHPPTIYFPMVVKEGMMIEPTETESKETLDSFIAAMRMLAAKVDTDPQSFHDAPVTTPISRPDEVMAVKKGDFASL